MNRADDFTGLILATALDHTQIDICFGNLPRFGGHEKEGENTDDEPLPDAKIEKGLLEALILDHVLDGNNSQSRSGPEACGCDARSQSAFVGKPFQGIANTGAIDTARPDTANNHGRVIPIKAAECGGA